MARLVFLGSFAYLMVGLAQLVIGAVMEPMVHAYGVHYGDGGQLVMHQFLGGMAGVLSAPWLMKRIGKKSVLLSALALIAIIQVVYFLQPSWTVMLCASPLTGVGFGITEAVVGSFVIRAAGANANRAMSRIEVFFGIGALLMPFIGALLIHQGIWRIGFLVVSVFAVATFVLWMFFWPAMLDRPHPEAHRESEAGKRHAASLGAGKRLALTACILFFVMYVGFEMSFIHFLPSVLVLKNEGLSESAASLSISLYWLAMAIGRMVAGHAADRWGGATYLVSMCGANAVCFLLMIGLNGVGSTFVLTIFAGLAMSGMFSIALVFSTRALPGLTERTTSLLMASGGIGGALVPKLTGWFLDHFGPDHTRLLFGGFGIVLLISIVWAVSAVKPKRTDVALSA